MARPLKTCRVGETEKGIWPTFAEAAQVLRCVTDVMPMNPLYLRDVEKVPEFAKSEAMKPTKVPSPENEEERARESKEEAEALMEIQPSPKPKMFRGRAPMNSRLTSYGTASEVGSYEKIEGAYPSIVITIKR